MGGNSISAGAVGLFGFLYTLLTKFIPMISLWEYKQGTFMEGVESVGGGRLLVAIREEEIG